MEDVSTGELAQIIFIAMNTRDLSALERHLSATAIFDFPGAGRIEGSRRILIFLKALFRKYPRLRFTVDDILVAGQRACIVWTNEGESARGTVYKNSGVTLVRLSCGKIDFISDYFKDTSFVEQI
ncbi:MAG: nuclear transport factor 2 family protein [Pseudomonadota bacterium]